MWGGQDWSPEITVDLEIGVWQRLHPVVKAGFPEPPDVSLCTRSVHQVAAASVSMTTGSDIPTAVVQCMAWSPGEPRNQKSRITGPACPPAKRYSLPSSSLGTLGAGSDYASFIHFLGISSMDLAYTYDRVSSLQRHFPPSTDASDLRGRFGTDWPISVSCCYD